MTRTRDASGSPADELRAFGLRYPGAHTKSPWPGHLDLAVKDKTFVYLSLAGEPLKVSCKLPFSAEAALSLPFTEPTPYGLGKSGWVTATFPDGARVPLELLRGWVDESYRAQAPKRMSAGLPALGAAAGSGDALSLASAAEARGVRRRSTVKQVRPPRAAEKRAGAKPAAKRGAAAPGARRRVAAGAAGEPPKRPRAAKAEAVDARRSPRAAAQRPAPSAAAKGARGRPPARPTAGEGVGQKRAASKRRARA